MDLLDNPPLWFYAVTFALLFALGVLFFYLRGRRMEE
jgi:hypothetical protein